MSSILDNPASAILAASELDAIPYDLTRNADGSYTTFVDHDGHADDADCCQECEAELRSIQAALPPGWKAEWTGDGNGTSADVCVSYRAAADACCGCAALRPAEGGVVGSGGTRP